MTFVQKYFIHQDCDKVIAMNWRLENKGTTSNMITSNTYRPDRKPHHTNNILQLNQGFKRS